MIMIIITMNMSSERRYEHRREWRKLYAVVRRCRRHCNYITCLHPRSIHSSACKHLYVHDMCICTYTLYVYIHILHVHIQTSAGVYVIYTCTYTLPTAQAIMYVCVYVCIYIYIYIHVYIYIYIYRYVMYVCMYVCMHVCMYVMYVCMYVCM